MKFKVEPEIFKKFPGVRIGVLVVLGMDNTQGQKEIERLLSKEEEEKRKEFTNQDPKTPLKIAYWREAYKKFGSNPRKTRPSVEALLRRVINGNKLPQINPLVDLYNYISLKYLLPAGAEDLDKIEGDIVLGFAKGDEGGKYIGSDEVSTCYEGEVVYKDDEGFICRRWNWREGDRTKIELQSQNVVVVIEANPEISEKEFEKALNETAESAKKYLKAQVEIKILDGKNLSFEIGFKPNKRAVRMTKTGKSEIDPKILIGKIRKLGLHPQADKLWVVEVDIGQKGLVEVVCSATNLEEGQIVPLVLPGGQVISEKGKLFKVKKVEIRGVESSGMMCSEWELGVGEDHEGIWILPKSLEKHLGEPLVKHLEEIK